MYKITADTGGTFTDVVVTDSAGRVIISKALTTYSRVSEGLGAAITIAASQLGMNSEELLAQTDLMIFGTTIATNAVTTRRIAKTALLVTDGCREMLSIRQGGSPSIRETTLPYPTPFIPRRHTFTVKERINSEGGIEVPLDEPALKRTLNEVKALGFEAVAVSLLWSMLNPLHEHRIGELIQKHLYGVPYTLSCELLPVIREYPRTVTTAVDASLKPIVERDLGFLESDLKEMGYAGTILVSTSLGGCMELKSALQQPVYLLRSGPAMAPVAARSVSVQENTGANTLVCDTGGTTFDVGLILENEISKTKQTWLGPERLGELIGLPMVDIRSLGAGGGSIAWVDEGGMLHVGPQSAKSEPGPACYGRGGQDATVTDAALVLGYLDPNHFLGGTMPLDVDAGHRVVEGLAERLGKPKLETAFGILRVLNENMISGIANITVSEGLDPREAAFVAGGGGAGLNILAIAKELGCQQVIIPPTAGVLSAFGMQVAPIKTQFSVSAFSRSQPFDFAGAKQAFTLIRQKLDNFASKVSPELLGEQQIQFFAGVRYPMQIVELDVLIEQCPKSIADVESLIENFHRMHERIYAHRDAGSPIEIVYWKGELTIQISDRYDFSKNSTHKSDTGSGKMLKYIDAYFGDQDMIKTPVYTARDLNVDKPITGPVIVHEPTTTIVVYPGMTLRVSKSGNYICDIGT